jgi:hypothetical protein
MDRPQPNQCVAPDRDGPGGERAAIRATIDRIEAVSGTRGVGWLGAGLAETWNTLDYLAEAGIRYVCDWVNDDQPYLFEIGTPPLVSLPYSVQTNDVPAYFEMKKRAAVEQYRVETLNILLSFAQFEREVIGERIRDKIAASKRKGMWMGGVPPLGYRVRDRRLLRHQSIYSCGFPAMVIPKGHNKEPSADLHSLLSSLPRATVVDDSGIDVLTTTDGGAHAQHCRISRQGLVAAPNPHAVVPGPHYPPTLCFLNNRSNMLFTTSLAAAPTSSLAAKR